MAITAAMVKELREMTGAGMMDCKKALTKTEGDMDAAVEFLRENGLAKAAKKAGRIAAEGLVAVALSDDAKEAAIVEVNSETDFVAKNDTFKAYVAEVADQALTTAAADIEGFLAEDSKAEAGKTVKEALDGKIAVIGENLNIRRFAKVSAADGFVASYIHAGGKIGVLVEVATDVVNDEIKEMAKNVAMQVAAISPKYTSRDEVSKDYIEHETEILKVQAMNENPDKPENIIEKMIVGRLNKELKEAYQAAPDKIIPLCWVNANEGQEAYDMLEHYLRDENFAGVKMQPLFDAFTADSPMVDPIMEIAEAYKKPVFIHCGHPPYSLPWQIGLLAERHPHVPTVMIHMGHGDGVYIEGSLNMAYKYDNLFLEVSGMPMGCQIKNAYETVGSERVMFGIDSPFHHPSVEIQRVYSCGLNDGRCIL